MKDEIKAAKAFTKKHKKGIIKAAAFGSWSAICYGVGVRAAKNHFAVGLEKVVLVNPEIKTLIDDAIVKVNKIIK